MCLFRSALLGVLFAVLLVAVGASSPTLLGFEPGGGGADQQPPVVEPDGSVRIELRLTVWGGGGAIHGRNTDVFMYVRAAGGTTVQLVPERLVPINESMEAYIFSISRASHGITGPVDYYFEVSLDGHRTRIPGMHTVSVP